MLHADLRNKDFYSGLSPELQESFSPFVAMRWMSSVSDSSKYRDEVLILVNEFMNKDYGAIKKEHNELHWKMLALCGPGVKMYHNWIPAPKRTASSSKLEDFLWDWFPRANKDEINILLNKMTRDDFENFVKSTGASDPEVKEIMEMYDKQNGRK